MDLYLPLTHLSLLGNVRKTKETLLTLWCTAPSLSPVLGFRGESKIPKEVFVFLQHIETNRSEERVSCLCSPVFYILVFNREALSNIHHKLLLLFFFNQKVIIFFLGWDLALSLSSYLVRELFATHLNQCWQNKFVENKLVQIKYLFVLKVLIKCIE